jgi:AbrB family looped-hinge helix DNA binding protein
MSTTVTSKGQVTIPKRVRDLLGIGPGSKVDFERAPDGRIVLIKLDNKKAPSRFARVLGCSGARVRRQGLEHRRDHGHDPGRGVT